MFALRQLRSCCNILAFVCYQLCWQIRDVLWLMEASCLHRTCLCGTTAVKPLIGSVFTSFSYSLFDEEARQEVGRDSAVGIATRYGSGIESRWGKIFLIRPDLPGAHPASCTMGTGSFPGIKPPGRGVDHAQPPSAEVKERVDLYLYSSSGTSWPLLG